MFEIGAALSSFSAIKQIGRTIYEAKVDVDVKEKAREILDKLGDAQDVLYQLREELLRLQGENSALQDRLRATENWQAREAEYTLVPAEGGAFVWRNNMTPSLFACPVCANDRKIVPLQDNRNSLGTYSCPACKAAYPIKQREAYRPPRSAAYGPGPL